MAALALTTVVALTTAGAPAAVLQLPSGPTLTGEPLIWSLLLSGALVVASLVPLGAGRASANFTLADLAAPRAMFERLPPWGQRASWAHQNGFEAFTLHAPACLLALLLGAHGPLVALAAWAHPLLRLLYLGAYVGNQPLLRSLCWAGALGCTGALYLLGLLAAPAA